MYIEHPLIATLIVMATPLIMFLFTRKVKLFRKKPYMYIPVLLVPMLLALHFLVGDPW